MAKKHTEEFRQEVVCLALMSSLPRRLVAEDLGVGVSTLAKWIQRLRSVDEFPQTWYLKIVFLTVASYSIKYLSVLCTCPVWVMS